MLRQPRRANSMQLTAAASSGKLLHQARGFLGNVVLMIPCHLCFEWPDDVLQHSLCKSPTPAPRMETLRACKVRGGAFRWGSPCAAITAVRGWGRTTMLVSPPSLAASAAAAADMGLFFTLLGALLFTLRRRARSTAAPHDLIL